MLPEEKDAAYLWDIVTAAREVQEFISGLAYDGYLKDRKCQRAVERNLEVIGEAARKISPSFQEKHPDIPWRAMVGQRNVLAHEYGEVSQDRLWRVASTLLPDLLGKLQPLLPDISRLN